MVKKRTVLAEPAYIRDVLEIQISKYPDWWKLVKDTTKMHDDTTRLSCTKIYQLYIHDKPTDCGIKFFYDYRSGEAEATYDIVALKVMKHQTKEDFDIDIIGKYIEDYVEKNKPTKPWWKYV